MYEVEYTCLFGCIFPDRDVFSPTKVESEADCLCARSGTLVALLAVSVSLVFQLVAVSSTMSLGRLKYPLLHQ